MNALHRLLTYIQLEDEGELSAPMLTFYVSFVVAMFCMLKGMPVPVAVLLTFGVGTVGQTLAEGAKVMAQRQAERHANEQAIAQTAADATIAVAKVSTDADAHADRVEKLAEQVQLLATPERVAAAKTIAQQLVAQGKMTQKQGQQIDRL